MNIGIFTEVYLPQINGVVTTICTLEKELKLLGHNVYIFTNYYPGYNNDNSNVFRLPSIPFALDKACRIGSFYSHEIMKEIKKIKLDIIHTNTEFSMGLFGRIVAKKLRIPVVHTYHTIYEDWVNDSISNNAIAGIASNVVISISKSHCNICNKIIVPSMKVRKLLVGYGIKKNIEILPNGIELEPFYKINKEYTPEKIIEFKKSIGINENDKVLLNIGRQSKEKNIESIFYALEKLVKTNSNIKLVIVGDGPNKENLEDLSEKLKLKDNIIFLGKKPRKDIEKYYKIADIFITPSTFETQGLTVLEAMAANIPVVVKKDEAFEDIIENDVTGFIFENDEELADLINRLLNNKILLNDISNNAFSKIENFSAIGFSKNIERIYQEEIKNY